MDVFFSEVPVLQLIGSTKLIDRTIPYDVNEDVQLVCKYLQAYDVGNIDNLYDERKRLKLVQFSKDQNLSDKDCHRLLEKYMENHIADTKITQQLFVRWMLEL